MSAEEAKELIENPLKDFPHDIDYLSEKDIADKVKQSNFMMQKEKSKPGTIRPDILAAAWDPARVQAARGQSNATKVDPDVAQRAAQNDVLWVWFNEMTAAGVRVTMELLKERVHLDVVRSKLYPTPDYEAQKNRVILNRISIGVMTGGVNKAGEPVGEPSAHMLRSSRASPFLKTDYTSPTPPEWFMKEFERTPQAQGVVKELCRIGGEEV